MKGKRKMKIYRERQKETEKGKEAAGVKMKNKEEVE